MRLCSLHSSCADGSGIKVGTVHVSHLSCRFPLSFFPSFLPVFSFFDSFLPTPTQTLFLHGYLLNHIKPAHTHAHASHTHSHAFLFAQPNTTQHNKSTVHTHTLSTLFLPSLFLRRSKSLFPKDTASLNALNTLPTVSQHPNLHRSHSIRSKSDNNYTLLCLLLQDTHTHTYTRIHPN